MKNRRGGFTLVELVVAIVIMGILAAVAVPAYNGYVAKANEAGDLQLLAAVNNAWAAACLDYGKDTKDVAGGAALGADGTVAAITPSEYQPAFFRYFGEEKDRPFQVYKSLWYNQAAGLFENAVGTVEFDYNGTKLSIEKADLAAYQASSFAEMGFEQLGAGIDALAGKALSSPSVTNGFEALFTYLMDLQGHSDMSREDYYDTYYSKMSDQEKANALVLLAASQSRNIDQKQLAEDMSEGKGIAINGLNDGVANTAVAVASARYAMLYAYANSEYAKETTETKDVTIEWTSSTKLDWNGTTYNNPKKYADAKFGANNYTIERNPVRIIAKETTTFDPKTYFNEQSDSLSSLSGLQQMYQTMSATEGFQTYMSGQGANDLEGYFAAMNAISDNAGNVNTSSILTEGYAAQAGWLKSVLGS